MSNATIRKEEEEEEEEGEKKGEYDGLQSNEQDANTEPGQIGEEERPSTSGHSASHATPSPSLKGFGKMVPNAPLEQDSDEEGLPGKTLTSAAATDYHATLAGLELEFQVLDQEYHQILKGIDGNGNAVDTADSAEKLVTVIRQLHAKGAQLRDLRSSPARKEKE
jgi:hypothetical protein